MIVYHGSITEVVCPKILKSEIGRDFGFAFYTTDIKEQSERWALRKSKIEKRRGNLVCQAVINVYEWNERTEDIALKRFENTSMDWLEMVVNCRGNIEYSHPYDIVIGKIANDNVGETISYVMRGIMRKEDAIERLKFEKINNQIAFCTEKALQTLEFKRSYVCGEE